MKVRNDDTTPIFEINKQLLEPRPLPIGMQEFEDWSDRIISGALLPADHASQKFALADLLLHLGPTESHKADAFFIHSLRKFAVNQIAVAVRDKLHLERKAKMEAENPAPAAAPKVVHVDTTPKPLAAVLPISKAKRWKLPFFGVRDAT